SLVDPANRRPVDYAARRAMLDDFAARDDRAALVDELLAHWADGRIKLYLTWRLLQARRSRPDAFGTTYRPLESGDDGLVAFAREQLVVLAPRLARRRWTGGEPRVAFDDVAVRELPPARRYRNIVDDTFVTTTAAGTLAA